MRVEPSPSSQSASPSRAELSTASCESSRAESKNASSSQVLEFSRGKDKKNKAKSNQPFSLPKKVAKIFFLFLKKSEITGFLAASIIFSHFFSLRVGSASCEPMRAGKNPCESASFRARVRLEATSKNFVRYFRSCYLIS